MSGAGGRTGGSVLPAVVWDQGTSSRHDGVKDIPNDRGEVGSGEKKLLAGFVSPRSTDIRKTKVTFRYRNIYAFLVYKYGEHKR